MLSEYVECFTIIMGDTFFFILFLVENDSENLVDKSVIFCKKTERKKKKKIRLQQCIRSLQV
jgi:hypothetical protein